MLSAKPSKIKRGHTAKVIAFVVSLSLVIAAFLVFYNRQLIIDQLLAIDYQPSSAVAQIATTVNFTANGKRTFYATHPEIATANEFNRECPRQETQSAILGCYTSDDRIFVYDVTNTKLNGIKEVTAVHELLHAVWQRTSNSDREKLVDLLNKAYQSSTDTALKTRMEYYRRTEPQEINNELHSIMGTEAENLGPDLEAYYSKIFNRNAVLALHNQYKQVYANLMDRSEQLYASMTELSNSIESRSQQYTKDIAQLNVDITAFNDNANSGGFRSLSQFNSERSALVARSEALDSQRTSINGDIATYDSYYSEYQSIASEIKVLNESTDSFHTLEAVPSV